MKKKPAASPKNPVPVKPVKDFSAVFSALQQMLQPYEEHLSVVPYRPEFYCLQTRKAVHKGKPVWFAAIRMGKNYVSYHLMPVYMNAALQKRIPAGVKETDAGQGLLQFQRG